MIYWLVTQYSYSIVTVYLQYITSIVTVYWSRCIVSMMSIQIGRITRKTCTFVHYIFYLNCIVFKIWYTSFLSFLLNWIFGLQSSFIFPFFFPSLVKLNLTQWRGLNKEMFHNLFPLRIQNLTQQIFSLKSSYSKLVLISKQ